MNFILEKDVIDFAAYEKENEVKQTMKSADIYVRGLIDRIHKPLTTTHRFLPWPKARALFQFRRGEVTVWGGENGVGKSLVTGQAALSLMAQDEKCCIASFEMKPIRTVARMARQFTGWQVEDQLTITNPEAKAAMLEALEEFRQWTKGKLWLYNKQGTVKWPNVVAMAKYAARELKCTQIFVDNLGKCVQGEDDYNGQKEFMDQICAVARDEDIHIHVVHHVRKPSAQNGRPDKYAFKGTGAITDQPDNVIIVWRNKAKEHEPEKRAKEADTTLIIDKQRNGEGLEGDIALWYLRASQQFVERPFDEPMEFYRGPQ